MQRINADATTVTWRNSVTDNDAVAAARALQLKFQDQASGDSWADAIKKRPPEQRLKMAIDHLPLPAAFNEAAIALRTLIAQHMKERRDPSASLKLLYWISAVASFMPVRAEKAQTAGFSVVATIPGTKLFGLQFEWKTLGYEKLPLLVGQDVRMLIALWGPPESHSTLLELHGEVWDEYEGKLVESIREHNQTLADQLASSLDADGGVPLPIRLDQPKR